MLRHLRTALAILLAAPLSLTAQFPVTWRSIGPVNTGGRIDDIAVARVAGEPDAIYIATASGGVFKSSNNGVSFQPVFDKVDAMMSIGAIAVAPSSPQTVFAGTGEANTRQSSSWGDGVYKSTDGGKTWANVGLRDTKSIGRIVVDPTDPNIVYVAAQGHLWGPNAERGVFKTSDGGRTWSKVLFVDENTGANDLVIDPADPRTLYASTYQRERRTWGFNGGGPGSGIYKTTDAGAHWTKLTTGLPSDDKGRIALAIYATDPRIVYATIEARAGEQGIYATTDAGATWTRTSSLNTRPNYFSQIRIDPTDKARVYTLGSNRGFYISNDGGHAFTELFSNVHGEDHALWIDPADGNHMIIAGDGGVSISWDRGTTWDFRRNMPIGQFYEVDVDNSVPFRVCGGLQDNGVWCTPSAVRDRNGIADRDAWNIGGGDGFHAHFDPANDNLVLQSSQNGNAAWVNITTLERQPVRPGSGDRPQIPPPPPGKGYRWNWDTPIVVSHHDPRVWFMGAQYLFKSTDRGSSWQKISPDLTLDINRDTLKMMGAVVGPNALSRHDGQTSYGSLTTIGESPLDTKVIYTGSDDGQLQLTRDGGKTWTNLTKNVTGLPEQTYVSAVLPSKYKAGRVYATFDGHFMDDYKPYVYVSEDYGATWRSLANGLPETSVNRIREHPTNPRVLVIGHARGVHFSNDGGATWTSLATNLPTVPVNDLIFQQRDNALVIGTHGRGIWVLDDVSPLAWLDAEARTATATMLPIHAARLMSTHTPQAWYGEGEHFAPNPEWDAVIEYNLRDAASGPAQVTVTDLSGKVIRELKGPAAKGMNRVVWNLRYDSPVDSTNVPGAGGRGGRGGGGRGGPPAAVPVGFARGGEGEGGGRGGPPVGPLVMPGSYNVRVNVPGIDMALTGRVAVEADPLPRFSAADRATRQAILMRIYDWSKTLGQARIRVRSLHADSLTIDSLRTRIDRAFTAMNAQRGPIEGWSGAPTVDQQKAVGYAIDDATKALADLKRLEGPAASPKKKGQ
ncbi:MAG TPA: hypothetical protein VN706_10540 [Gemmatimonadaceae bacterium]|nr:hypothetical protein [Gemmatimonadaceae bacterium]